MSERTVKVVAGDYEYDGWEIGVVTKRSGQQRSIVEDENGRLFIHRREQVKDRNEALVFIETRRTVKP